jgi:hypothetical protein
MFNVTLFGLDKSVEMKYLQMFNKRNGSSQFKKLKNKHLDSYLIKQNKISKNGKPIAK